MRKHLLPMILLVILLMPVALAVTPLVPVVSATGNVTINDFSSNVTKGTIPLDTRLTANVTGNVTSWVWVFHNTAFNKTSYSSGNRTTQHAFGRTGVYGVFNVTLVVSGPDGNASLKKIAYVTANKNVSGLPVAAFSASPTSGYAPLNVTFTDNSTDATSGVWYFGNRGSSTEKNPSYEFSAPGKYTAVLVVNNTNGWDTQTQEITVQGDQSQVPVLPDEQNQVQIPPIAEFDANTANGLNVQFTDLSQNANVWYWDFGDETSSADRNPVHTYSSAGNYNVNLIVSNEIGTASKAATINVLEESSSNDNSDSDDGDSGGSSHSSGSSSGGGAGGSPEPQSNVEVKELSQTFISSGKAVKFEFPRNTTSVVYVSFDSKKTAGRTTAIAEMLKGKSTLVTELPSDEVYKSLNIWVGTGGFATPKNIENAVVSFKVEKSWIQDKNIDQSSITLNRYNDTKWDSLSTNLSGDDETYLYFTAETPAFSHFTITGKPAAKETVDETQSESSIGGPVQKNESTEANVEQTPEQTQSPSTSGEKGTKTPGFEAICSIVSLFAVFLHKRK
jgi:PGF-pre-PGF domain-containing protein